MIHAFTAFTFEIDDLDAAAEKIKKQLDLPGTMKKNTIGILACHHEFVLSGAVKAICDSLPFDVIGNVTTAQAVNGQNGVLVLSLMILTSDDVMLTTVLTGSLKGDFAQAIEKGYQEAASTLPEPPSLLFTIAPFMMENSGDAYVDTFNKLTGGVPCFGTMAVDDSSDFANAYTIYNGGHYRDRMAIALVCGDVHPRFYLATISENKIVSHAALITSSEGHILKEVNDKSLVEYFKNQGLTSASETSYAMTSLPFMIDYNDGTPPVAKVFVALNEEGYGICAGAMPQGASLYLGTFDKDDVLLTTQGALEDAVKNQDASVMLIYSCISRNLSLDGDILAELELVEEKVGERFRYLMAYSGGEVCPTQISENKAVNRFHNNTFILCVF